MNPEVLVKLRVLCAEITKDPENADSQITELKCVISELPPHILKKFQMTIFSVFYLYLTKTAKDKTSIKQSIKQCIIESLSILFNSVKITTIVLFFNLYGFLLNEIYDPKQSKIVAGLSEEYKLQVIKCTTSITKAVSSDIVLNLYSRENAPKLSQMLFVALEMAKTELFRTLRISCIECVMAMANVHDDADIEDVELRNQIADVFMFFIPGIATGLKTIISGSETQGHAIVVIALRAWGRIVALQMQDYNNTYLNVETVETTVNKANCKNIHEMTEYMQNSNRTLNWYKQTDKNLVKITEVFVNLTHNSHPYVRLELCRMCCLLIRHCIRTMPISLSSMIEILIILSEDENKETAENSKTMLSEVTENLNLYKTLLENLEENFYKSVLALPRVFNSFDKLQQLSALNLLVGYLKLFGKNKLAHVLYSLHLHERLIEALLQISKMDTSDVSLLEEYSTRELNPEFQTPWLHFYYFRDDLIQQKLQKVCKLLADEEVLHMVFNVLQNAYLNQEQNRKQATFLLNELIAGLEVVEEVQHLLLKDVIDMYLEVDHWNLPLQLNKDSENYSLGFVQSNIIQLCLQLQGIGKVALVLKQRFQQFSLKSLYVVFECAGSGHPLISAAGLMTIANISTAFGFSEITSLINANSDYFSYHILRKIHRTEDHEGVLNVLGVFMKYSEINVLTSISDVINRILLQTSDKYRNKNLKAYLRVFKMFFQCLHRWLNVKIKINPFRTKAQKIEDTVDFKISNLDYSDDFSDDMDKNKTAEEMYLEDLAEKQNLEEPEEIEAVKPKPPTHIQLTVAVLNCCLHFLPSKDDTVKLLVLEILSNGMEILQDWEDELLPLVHQIWSPLTGRFKDHSKPLLINYSFQLLITLARLSKDFIGSRTSTDVLPHLRAILIDLSKESYLKDKGSAYRYTQAYKLQQILLENLSMVLVDLDATDVEINAMMDTVTVYLSDKQPLSLQELCVNLFCILGQYDPPLIQKKLSSVTDLEYDKNLKTILNKLILS